MSRPSRCVCLTRHARHMSTTRFSCGAMARPRYYCFRYHVHDRSRAGCPVRPGWELAAAERSSSYDQSVDTGAATIRSLTGKTYGPVCRTMPAANASPVWSRSQARWRASEAVTVAAALTSIPINCPLAPRPCRHRRRGIPGVQLLTSGDILLCDLNPVAGREQGGIRPVLVVSHHRYSVIPGSPRQQVGRPEPATQVIENQNWEF
jgi:hypothetical protein